MPYIPQGDRTKLDAVLDCAAARCGNVGELTYALTRLCLRYLPDEPRFSDYAEVTAALEVTKIEVYATRIGPYEAKKRKAHGDVLLGNPEDTTKDGW
jgi:hypothetical protein